MIKKEHLAGIIFTIAIAGVGFIAHYTIGLAGAEVYALLIGIVVGNLFTTNKTLQPGISYSEKKILGWAIALMGLQLNFRLLNISWWLIPVLLLVIVVVMFLGKFLSDRFSMNSSCGYMIGVGHAICGASAIAAISPLLNKEGHETGVAVGVVNVLGTIGMLVFPFVVISLGFTQEESGVFMGGTLQAVGNVVGAGYAVGDEAGQVATLVKLGRVLMLGPVVIFTAFAFHSKENHMDRKKVLPGFILVFLVLLLVVNVFQLPTTVLNTFKQVDKILLAIAMAGIGLQIKFADLKSKGPKALMLGSVIFASQIAIVLMFIYGQQYFN